MIRGPLLESITLHFEDGFRIKLRDVPKDQGDQVKSFLEEGLAAFDRDRLTAEQLTNCCYAYSFARVIPNGLLN